MNDSSTFRLYRAELLRIRHRRLTKVVFAVVALAFVAGGARTFTTSSTAPPDMAALTAQAEASMAQCRADLGQDPAGFSDRELADMCFVDPVWLATDDSFHLQGLLTGNGSQPWSETRRAALDRPEYVVSTDGTTREQPANGFDGDLTRALELAALVAVLLGASYIGADWRSGVVESHVIWEPNRSRLISAKLAASATAGAVLAVVFAGLIVVTLLPSAIWRGDIAGTGPGFWADIGLTTGRGAIAAALHAALAAGIAVVARNTAAGVVVVVAWSMTASALASVFGSWFAYLSPYSNLTAFVTQADVAIMKTIRFADGSAESFMVATHTWSVAGLLLAAVAVASATFGAGVFARRDLS